MLEQDIDDARAEAELQRIEERLKALRASLADVVRTRRVKILDRRSVCRVLFCDSDGFAMLGLNAANRYACADLLVRDDGMPMLRFLGQGGSLGLSVAVERRGCPPSVGFSRHSSSWFVWLGVGDTAEDVGLFAVTRDTSTRVALSADPNGEPSLGLRGPRRKGTLMTPESEKGWFKRNEWWRG